MNFLARLRQAADTPIAARIAKIAVVSNGAMLMGKRKDNGRWTQPGGHVDAGETNHEGAVRELFEETGLAAGPLYLLGSEQVIRRDGKTILVSAYRWDTYRRPVTLRHDPDEEVSEWRWVPLDPDRPEFADDARHSPKDVLLALLGLIPR